MIDRPPSSARLPFLRATEPRRCKGILIRDKPFPHRARCPRVRAPGLDLCPACAELERAGERVARVPH